MIKLTPDELTKLVEALQGLPENYDTNCSDKQKGYSEGVCDSINIILKLVRL